MRDEQQPSLASGPALEGEVRPAHGGVLRPWQAGRSGNPGGRSNEMKLALQMARQNAPAAMGVLVELMGDEAQDPRVRLVAAAHVLDRALGKAKEAPPQDKEASTTFDASHLTADERMELAGLLTRLRQITQGGEA